MSEIETDRQLYSEKGESEIDREEVKGNKPETDPKYLQFAENVKWRAYGEDLTMADQISGKQYKRPTGTYIPRSSEFNFLLEMENPEP